MNVLNIFLAGFVKRWHSNPDMAHTNDRTDGHSGRLARLLLAMHPEPSVALLTAALTHDDGEALIGDMCGMGKRLYPGIAAKLGEIEAAYRQDLWGDRLAPISEREIEWLKFADRLDAYMWAAHHNPQLLTRDGWPEARKWIWAMAEDLGCIQQVGHCLREMDKRA